MFKRTKPKNTLDVDARFLLANERTLLAWIRTGLALIGGGVAVGVFAEHHQHALLVSLGAVVMGAVVSVIGYARYREADRAIRSGQLPRTGAEGLLIVVGVAVFAGALVVILELI